MGLSVLKVFAFWGKKKSPLLLGTIDYFSVFGIIFFLCPNLELFTEKKYSKFLSASLTFPFICFTQEMADSSEASIEVYCFGGVTLLLSSCDSFAISWENHGVKQGFSQILHYIFNGRVKGKKFQTTDTSISLMYYSFT